MSKIVIGLVSLALAAGSVLASPRPQSTHVSSIGFDDFMRLDPQNRRERFNQLDPTNKAMLVRTHAERWLAKNRDRLGASEQACIEEAITLATPEVFNPPVDPTTARRQDEFTERYRCRVNPADVSAAFDVLGLRGNSARNQRWTYLSQAKCWIAWFTESAIDFLPSTPPPKR
jgi:hypothetical protein